MDLHLFFEGKLSSEEVASAFLASLLEQRPEVRRAFFDVLAESLDPAQAERLKQTDWTVQVEENHEDIHLEARDGSSILIIENKLLAASKQKGQLLRYYARHAKQDPDQRTAIGAVYLAPGTGIGEIEVQAVRDSDLFQRRKMDVVGRISWEKLVDALETLAADDSAGRFIASGLEHITRVIAGGGRIKYPVVGDRRVMLDIVTAVRQRLLEQFPAIQLGSPWPGREFYVLSTGRTNLTMWLSLVFAAETTEPYRPVDIRSEDGRLQLTVRAELKLSAVGRKQPGLQQRWEELTRTHSLMVQDRLLAIPEGGRWAVAEYPIMGTQPELVARMAEIGEALLRVVMDFNR